MNMENESDAWKKIADQNKTKEKEKTQNETELTGKWVSTKQYCQKLVNIWLTQKLTGI